MTRLTISVTLTIVTGSLLVSYLTLPVAAAFHGNSFDSLDPGLLDRNKDLVHSRIRPIYTPGTLCADPMPNDIEECQRVEQHILASTVRLEWHLWILNDYGNGYTNVKRRVGHATIKEGRYLVTHNHPGMLLSDLKNGQFITVSVFSANGEPIWLEVPPGLISIVAEETETLVIEFGNYTGKGPFATKDLISAEFKAWESLPLQPGMEVAQIDWNGEMAHVDWVTIEDVVTENGTPRLELANFITGGTSGGGIFWNGYHVANTWYQATELDPKSKAVLRQFSVAALNSPEVVRSGVEGAQVRGK